MASSAAILVVQQVPHEPPALIGRELTAAGLHYHTVLASSSALSPHSIPTDASGYQGVVIMGGPSAANGSDPAITQQLALLTWCLHHDAPVLGICLGAQLMAKAAGGRISGSPQRELGWYPVYPTADTASDPLFASMPETGLTVFQWHGETFSIPDAATLVASHPEVPSQAIRLGRAQYALQFHLEVDARLIAQWIAAGDSEREHLGEAGMEALHDGTRLHIEAMQAYCRSMMHSWLNLLNK